MAVTYIYADTIQLGRLWTGSSLGDAVVLTEGVLGITTGSSFAFRAHAASLSMTVDGYLSTATINTISLTTLATDASVFIGATGTVQIATLDSGSVALFSSGAGTSISNYGTIRGSGAVYLSGDDGYIENHGSILATPNFSDGFLLGSVGVKLGRLSLETNDYAYVVVNYGVISGTTYSIASLADSYSDDASEDSVFNHGILQGAVDLGTLDDLLENSGQIEGDILLGAGDDTFLGRNGGTYSDKVEGGDGLDKLVGGDFDDNFNGGGDEDTLRGGDGDDILQGEKQSDLIRGGKGEDEVKGGQAADELHGNRGDDTLLGGSGQDMLFGGRGDDTLTGGSNPDDFVFKDGFGRDLITDFDATDNAEDIDLSGVTAITGWSDLSSNHMAAFGSNVVIDAGAGNTITLLGVDIADLGAADFLF